jgi:hypothetical protein
MRGRMAPKDLLPKRAFWFHFARHRYLPSPCPQRSPWLKRPRSTKKRITFQVGIRGTKSASPHIPNHFHLGNKWEKTWESCGNSREFPGNSHLPTSKNPLEMNRKSKTPTPQPVRSILPRNERVATSILRSICAATARQSQAAHPRSADHKNECSQKSPGRPRQFGSRKAAPKYAACRV